MKNVFSGDLKIWSKKKCKKIFDEYDITSEKYDRFYVIFSRYGYKIKILGKWKTMQNYKRKYWNITEETVNKIFNLNNEYKEELENK